MRSEAEVRKMAEKYWRAHWLDNHLNFGKPPEGEAAARKIAAELPPPINAAKPENDDYRQVDFIRGVRAALAWVEDTSLSEPTEANLDT